MNDFSAIMGSLLHMLSQVLKQSTTTRGLCQMYLTILLCELLRSAVHETMFRKKVITFVTFKER